LILESLQAFNSPGKLKNYCYDAPEVSGHREGLRTLEEIEFLQELVSSLGTTTAYISTAEAILPAGHEWTGRMRVVREDILEQITEPAGRGAADFRQQTQRKLSGLKKAYLQAYLGLHTRARLGVNNEDKRNSGS